MIDSTPTLTADRRRERLINLATRVSAEDVKRRLDLPSEWDQSSWLGRDCGTTCCMAGKVALEDGGVPVLTDYNGKQLDTEIARRLWERNDPNLYLYDMDSAN